MEYKYLGKSGLKVSELCLGTMTFGRETDAATSHNIMDMFIDHGGNFIDTANVYSTGKSEEIIGQWLKHQQRENLIIATKVRFPMGTDPNQSGLSRKHIIDSLHASLKRLGTDYIDLYQIHCWDPVTPIEETLTTLNTLVEHGKVRYIGASNLTAWQLQKALDISKYHHLEAFVSLQPLYNLLDRDIEWDIVPICLNEGLGILPWSPLRGGWLSGKYKRGMASPPQDSRVKVAEEKGWSESWSAYNTERTWRILDELFTITKDNGHTPAQVALNWLLTRPGVTAPIIGVRTMQHLKDNLGAAGWQLPNHHLQRLNKVSEVKPPYPHSFIAAVTGDR